jgi:hypothetical protein
MPRPSDRQVALYRRIKSLIDQAYGPNLDAREIAEVLAVLAREMGQRAAPLSPDAVNTLLGEVLNFYLIGRAHGKFEYVDDAATPA